MKDKEKQIEEMAKDWDYVAHMLRFNDCYMLSLKQWSEPAEEMIKLGWIKPTEDSVVLSKEELSKRDYEFRQIGYDECLRDNPKKDKYIKKLERKIEQLKAKLDQASKETAEKFMLLRGYITNQFHKYHEARNIAESEYKKCKEEVGKAVLNNDWHRCDAIMFILEDIATEFDKLAKQFGVETKE